MERLQAYILSKTITSVIKEVYDEETFTKIKDIEPMYHLRILVDCFTIKHKGYHILSCFLPYDALEHVVKNNMIEWLYEESNYTSINGTTVTIVSTDNTTTYPYQHGTYRGSGRPLFDTETLQDNVLYRLKLDSMCGIYLDNL